MENHHFSWENHYFSWVNHHFSWENHHFSWENPPTSYFKQLFHENLRAGLVIPGEGVTARMQRLWRQGLPPKVREAQRFRWRHHRFHCNTVMINDDINIMIY
jgi:hypothetical protein